MGHSASNVRLCYLNVFSLQIKFSKYCCRSIFYEINLKPAISRNDSTLPIQKKKQPPGLKVGRSSVFLQRLKRTTELEWVVCNAISNVSTSYKLLEGCK